MAQPLKPDKRFFYRLDAHYRMFISLIVAVIACLCFRSHTHLPSLILITWMSFAVTVILMDWIIISTSHPREVRAIAKLQDSSRTVIFLFVLAASVASLGAIILLLKSAKGHAESVSGHILLSISSVVVSWWLVHTVFTLLYAHLYYNTDNGAKEKIGGLEFPGKDEPDYLDFVYFSFVIGMTFQTSDVSISSRKIRRYNLIHSLLSFAFNTAILALSINVISGLVSQ